MAFELIVYHADVSTFCADSSEASFPDFEDDWTFQEGMIMDRSAEERSAAIVEDRNDEAIKRSETKVAKEEGTIVHDAPGRIQQAMQWLSTNAQANDWPSVLGRLFVDLPSPQMRLP